MTSSEYEFHREREQHCRALAQSAIDPEVRRRHQELAEMHASRAAEAINRPPEPGFGSESGLRLA